ncbi:UBN2_2 domain-containing protein [Cephalotus follicularis]|uniref:UBN2_2 domain-containing protein n=1 Tax=Cephalotus follicularis TaxID=3775 RepID=A0A1Q3BBQ2_CEPFO|nr:UBN2_2 domain-containing protein [Cephalotus follicularis]
MRDAASAYKKCLNLQLKLFYCFMTITYINFLVIAVIPTFDSFHILILSCENFADWKEKILLTLGCMDIDLTLCVDEPPIPTELSMPNKKERSNRLSLMLIKSHVSKSIRSSIPDCYMVADYMKSIEKQFVRSHKALFSTVMKKLSGIRFDNSKTVHEHIMEMRDIAAQLEFLEVEISELFLVHFIYNSLPTEYGAFKISYNTHKEKLSVNELLTMCVQEEERFKHEKIESTRTVTHAKGNSRNGKGTLIFLVCYESFYTMILIINGGLIMILPFMLLIPCKVFST